MTKEEVLQGALALNQSDKNYTVTVEDDQIIIETTYYGTPKRNAIFRCVARLLDDRRYVETAFDADGYRIKYGQFSKTKASASRSSGDQQAKDGVFRSDEIQRVLRDYLHSCGYQKKKSAGVIALCVAVPIFAMALILTVALIIALSADSDFVDTNGPDNFALTEFTREDIVSPKHSYKSFMASEHHSGFHSDIVGGKLRPYDYDSVSRSFGKFHGIMILQATKTTQNEMVLQISSAVESGNAEIVILIDGAYYCSAEVNQNQLILLEDIANKEILVKLAGEGAKLKVDVTRILGR